MFPVYIVPVPSTCCAQHKNCNKKNPQTKFFHFHFKVTLSVRHFYTFVLYLDVAKQRTTVSSYLTLSLIFSFFFFFISFAFLMLQFFPQLFPLIVAINSNGSFSLLLEQRVIKWLISDGRVQMV